MLFFKIYVTLVRVINKQPSHLAIGIRDSAKDLIDTIKSWRVKLPAFNLQIARQGALFSRSILIL